MTQPKDPPPEAWEDPFRPPEDPCRVRCLHCGMEYDSTKILWQASPDGAGFWRCPTKDCGGSGFNFDIFPVDSPVWAGSGKEEPDDQEPDEEEVDEDEAEPDEGTS